MRIGAALLSLIAVLGGCAEFDYGGLGPRGGAGPPPTVYTVVSGDTLYEIAWRYGLDHRRVARWNGVGPPYTIYPNQRLRLRPPPRSATTAQGADRSHTTSRSKPSPSPTPRAEPARREPSEVATAGANGGPNVWRWPINGEVTRRFDPNGSGKRGISVAGSEGAPVRAAAAGRVVYSGNGLRGYGNLVILKHNASFLTAYGYNRELLVEEGDDVEAGEAIARMGRNPARETALHFEIRRDGRPVDPLRYLPER